jgi:hypothetical protein
VVTGTDHVEVVRLAIVEACRRYFCRRAETVALRAQTPEEWRAVVDDIELEAGANPPPALRHAVIAAWLMADGDAETAARELAHLGQNGAWWGASWDTKHSRG